MSERERHVTKRLPDGELARELEHARAGALEAGKILRRHFRDRGYEVGSKGRDNPVTSADLEADAALREDLSRAFPDYGWLSEETADNAERLSRRRVWIVDPLDGTKEFIHRRGEFTVNIALIRHGTPALGVVYAPVGGALYAGVVAGARAFRCSYPADAAAPGPREPLRVRPVPAAGITAVVSRSHSTPETDAYLSHYTVSNRVSVGSSLKFCLVAAGEADLYPRLGPTMEWDTAAGHAVLAAAGGKVLASGGAPLAYGKPDFRNGFFVASGTLTPVPLAA